MEGNTREHGGGIPGTGAAAAPEESGIGGRRRIPGMTVMALLGVGLPAWGVVEAWTAGPSLGGRDRQQVTVALIVCGLAWWSVGRLLVRRPGAPPVRLHGPARRPEEEEKRRRRRLLLAALLEYAILSAAVEAVPEAPAAAAHLGLTGGLILWAGLVASSPGVAARARSLWAPWTEAGRSPDAVLTVPGTSVVHFVDRSPGGGRTDDEGPAGDDPRDRPTGPP